MARAARIELTVDATGAVTGFRTAGDGAAGLERRLGSLDREVAAAERQLGSDLPRAAQASARAIGRDLVGSARGGQNVLLNLNRVVQDLPFGFVAIANNLDQLGESFARLTKESGGARDALQAIFAAFRGPGGILALISLASTAIIVFGDDIANAFGKGEKSAKKMRDAISELLTVTADVRKFRLDLKVAEDALADVDRQIREVQDQASKGITVTTGVAAPGVQAQALTEEQIALIKRLRAARANIEAQKEEREVQLLAAETIAKIAGVQEEQAETTEKGTAATKASTSAFQRAVEAVAELRANLQSLSTAGIPALVELERESSFLERRLIALQQVVEATVRPRGVEPRPQEALPDVELPEGQIRTFTDIQIEEMHRLEDEVAAGAERINILLAAMAETNAAIVSDSMGNFAQAFADAFEASGQKTREFFTLFKAFAIAEAIASTFVAANKALASAPPPFNFVLMAGVIAAGLANVARIAAAQPGKAAAGGGGTARAPAPQQTGPSETAAGLAVNAPRRQFGGPVTAGMPFLVGERGPELFIPRMGGRIVPSTQTAGMMQSPPVEVRVRGEARVRGDDIVFVWRRADSRTRDMLGER